jgi:hypothetical protein
LAPQDEWGNLEPPKIKGIKKESEEKKCSDDEEEKDWNAGINHHGSFHTPMVKNSNKNRRESAAWQVYNRLDDRRKESDDWGSAADLRK